MLLVRFVYVRTSWMCLVRDLENPVDFFFLKMLLSVLLLKRKTRLGERSSSALLHFAAGGGHPLSREVFHSGSLSVRELPQPTLLPKPPNDSYYAKGPCYPLGVSHGTVLNKYTILVRIWDRSSTKYKCYGITIWRIIDLITYNYTWRQLTIPDIWRIRGEGVSPLRAG